MNIKDSLNIYLREASLAEIKELKKDTLIFESGLLDSMGLLFLIEFLQEKFGIEVREDELKPENFESIDRIAHFVKEKLSSAETKNKG